MTSGLAGRFARIIRQCLRDGASVEIDGLGTFIPHTQGRFRFAPQTRPRVFLAYGEEDLALVKRLYQALAARGFDPWQDRKKLLPGQNWPRAIEYAIQASDFFIACFSKRSVSRRGGFQSELRYAVECATRIPLDDIFLIPIRLDDCIIPADIKRRIQYVNMYPDWSLGLERLIDAMSHHKSAPRRPDAVELPL